MKLPLVFSLVGLAFAAIAHAAEPAPLVTYEDSRLSNGIIAVAFDEQGSFSIHDAESAEIICDDEHNVRTCGSGVDV